MRKITPRALAIMDLIDRKLSDLWGLDSSCVALTEDMTREEQIMALIEKYLRRVTLLLQPNVKPIAF